MPLLSAVSATDGISVVSVIAISVNRTSAPKSPELLIRGVAISPEAGDLGPVTAPPHCLTGATRGGGADIGDFSCDNSVNSELAGEQYK